MRLYRFFFNFAIEKTVFFGIIDDKTADWVPSPRFTDFKVDFKRVRCFYAFIWASEGINKSKFCENRFLRSADILKCDISWDFAKTHSSFCLSTSFKTLGDLSKASKTLTWGNTGWFSLINGLRNPIWPLKGLQFIKILKNTCSGRWCRHDVRCDLRSPIWS